MKLLGPAEKAELRRSWALVARDPDTAMEMFYARLFDIAPQMKQSFERVDMPAQHARLAGAITLVVNGLDDLPDLIPTLRDLGARHRVYGATAEDYDTVGAALIWTLETGLGAEFRPETRAAWSVAYALVAGTMIQGADMGQHSAA